MTTANDIIPHILGRKIQKVSYFEINDPNHQFFYDGFDNCDLGILIEFDDQSHWHIGWKENERPEIGLGIYRPKDYYNKFFFADGTNSWKDFLNSEIVHVELEFVTEEWNIPMYCIFHFSNNKKVTICLGQELNLDRAIPDQIQYSEASDIYIYFQVSPEIIPVKLEVPIFDWQDESPSPSEMVKLNTTKFIGFLLLLAILILVAARIYYSIED